MSTIHTPIQYRTRSTATTVLAVLGGVLIVVGGLAAASAIGLIAVFGRDGAMDSGTHQVATSASAVVTDVAAIQNTKGVGVLTGWPTLQVTAGGGNADGVFIGIGPAADVDRYLAATAYDQVTSLTVDPFELVVQRTPGQPGSTLAAPTEQDFWVASASSLSTAELSWPVQDGDYRLVVMNADGTADLIAQARVQLVLPGAFSISMLALVSGVAVGLIGIALLFAAAIRSSRRLDRPNSEHRNHR